MSLLTDPGPNRPRGDLWALLGTAVVCLLVGVGLWCLR